MFAAAATALALVVRPNASSSKSVVGAQQPLLGGVEAGGTTFVVSVGRTPTAIEHRLELATTTPDDVLPQCVAFLRKHRVAAVGIASFGPVDADPESATYGHITTTPKKAWRNADILGAFRALGVSLGFNTDVQAAALGQLRHGGLPAGQHSCCYVTVGTGVGVGVVTAHQPVYGISHPEGGHIAVKRHPDDADFKGVCPYHGDCLEGLTNAEAAARRAGCTAAELKDLSDDHPSWDVEAHYLAQLCVSLLLLLSPQTIVLGGGVMRRGPLLDKIRVEARRLLNGYVPADIDAVIVRPRQHQDAGSIGALELAAEALKKQK